MFDERNVVELEPPDCPWERLVARRNDALAKLRAHKREELLKATEASLLEVKSSGDSGKLSGQDKIGVRVGKIINKYKLAKHFELTIRDASLARARWQDHIDSETALDGLYIIRTSLGAAQTDAPACVRNYKSLANVGRAFRSLKTIALKVRPIHHRLAERVRAHIYLCMLAYYVEWHVRQAWAPLLYADTEQAAKATRDSVAAAKRSKSAQDKAASHTHLDGHFEGQPAHSFATLSADLGTTVSKTCRTPGAPPDSPAFNVLTSATPHQQRALALINAIHL